MADSFTPNLNLRKPEVGAAFDTWGGVAGLNHDMDLLDAVFLATGLGTSVGIHVGTDKVLNVEGQLQQKDATDLTKVGTFSMDLIPTATTVDLKYPPASGTIATKEIVVATVQASHPVGTILSGYYGATPPSGYIFVDGRTIGDATSLATNRANADCERLFLHLWGLNMAVVGGRGATAAADWAAHKQLTLPNHSGRTPVGRDNLSGSAAGVLPGYTAWGFAGGLYYSSTGTFSMGALNNLNFGNVSLMAGRTYANATAGSGSDAGPLCGDNALVSGYTPINANFNISVSGGSGNFSIVQPSIAVDVIIAL